MDGRTGAGIDAAPALLMPDAVMFWIVAWIAFVGLVGLLAAACLLPRR